MFCNNKGIEIIYSPVNEHRASGCVNRTIGSLKIFFLTYAKEKNHGNPEPMIKREFSALKFAPNANHAIRAHHGLEANTILRNLTRKPLLQKLNWDKILKQKKYF